MLFLALSCLTINAIAEENLILKIDSLFIRPDTIKAQSVKSGYSIDVYWVLKNIGMNPVTAINPLWYIYAANVQTDSNLANGKKTKEGFQ